MDFRQGILVQYDGKCKQLRDQGDSRELCGVAVSTKIGQGGNSMKNSTKVRTGFLAVLFAGVVLCNPVVGFADILPNCIGYWLLCYGLNRLADLDGHISVAVRRFRILSALSIAQVLAAYFAYGVIEPQATNVYEMRSYIMLGAFLMLVAQWFFLLPAFRDLFRGLDYLAERYGVTSLTAEKKGKNAVQSMASLTRLFVVASSLLALLPELSGFSSLNGKGENGTPGFGSEWYSSVISSPEQAIDRYAFIDVLRALCAVASLIIAVIWLVSFVRLIRRILHEREWLETLDARYQSEILPQMGMLTVRCFSRSFYLLQLGIIFVASLRMNYYAILPSAVFALLTFLALFWVRHLVSVSRGAYAVCAGCAAVSIVQTVLNTSYLNRYEPEASLYQGDAYNLFFAVRLADAAEAAVTLILIAVLLHTMYRTVCLHTGTRYDGEYAENFSGTSSQRLHKRFAGRFKIIFVIFFLAAVAQIADAIFRLEYPWIWLFALALSFIGIMMFYSVLYELKSEISFRYESDGVNKNI